MSEKHPSHKTRFSWDASTFDEICELCGATDQVPGGWGLLALPCPVATGRTVMKLTEARECDYIQIGEARGLVILRECGDREPGFTIVHFEEGGEQRFPWDRHIPDVVLLGHGKLKQQIVLDPPHLFQTGDFVLRSGKKSKYKIECDALSKRDWAGIAAAVMEEKLIDVPFSTVAGVPRGGVPFATAMQAYVTPGVNTLLLCEDIVTTGGSIEKFRREHVLDSQWDAIRGVCFVARGKCPDWIVPLLQMRLPSCVA